VKDPLDSDSSRQRSISAPNLRLNTPAKANPLSDEEIPAPENDAEEPKRLSAKAARKDGQPLTVAEIEAAEAEAEAWARRVNSC
jgi:hypothetical protein